MPLFSIARDARSRCCCGLDSSRPQRSDRYRSTVSAHCLFHKLKCHWRRGLLHPSPMLSLSTRQRRTFTTLPLSPVLEPSNQSTTCRPDCSVGRLIRTVAERKPRYLRQLPFPSLLTYPKLTRILSHVVHTNPTDRRNHERGHGTGHSGDRASRSLTLRLALFSRVGRSTRTYEAPTRRGPSPVSS